MTKAVQLALKFGEFYAKDDDGRQAVAALDADLARLRVQVEQGRDRRGMLA